MDKKDKTTDPKYCIFEKRLCGYANNENGCFDCNAPSDSAMRCIK